MPTYNNTTRLKFRTPQANQKVVDFTTIIDVLGNDIDSGTVGWLTGTLAAIPAAGTAGRVYRATDTGAYFIDNGSVWLPLLVASAWQALTPATGFTSGGLGASARVEGDIVRLKGTLTNNTGALATNATFATIPSGLRPSQTLYSSPGTTPSNGASAALQITSAGALVVQSSINNGAAVEIDGVTYTLN